MKRLCIITVFFLCAMCIAAQQHRLADSLQKKIDHIEQNAQAARPDPIPTVLTEDEIKQGQHTSNPLLSIFNGTHNVTVEADAVGTAGKGKVHVRTVTIDGIEVPKMALEFFVNKYIKPKYPNLGIDSEFQLPDKIDAATVGYHKLTVTQK